MSPGGFRLGLSFGPGHVVWCQSSDERGADCRRSSGSAPHAARRSHATPHAPGPRGGEGHMSSSDSPDRSPNRVSSRPGLRRDPLG
ncbi:hypothetical protein FCV17_13060 [Mycobacterium avium subsp. hominissuis]|nr:hypothetical protein DBO90_06090 [Mycobacterium avium]QCR72594.1 hypothetical protein FCV17_13060 [Mycobacterium avium subsp. hominissuis]QCR75885.1 hypothetical protein FCV16_05605 [Mycobacterium avium subsp. hominissuis]QCR83436.1 hypothetical protein FCV18_21915 [Mycobacterium avium subsp. hominissuis]